MTRSKLFYCLALWITAVTACSSYNRADPPALFYPLGMTQTADNVAVIASNANSRFAAGQLVVIDAKKAAEELRVQRGNSNTPAAVLLEQHLVAQAAVPSLSHAPTIVQHHIWFTDRLQDKAIAVPLKQGSLACSAGATKQQDCRSQQISMPLNGDDPVKLTVLQNDPKQVVMAVVFAHSHKVQTFSYAPQHPQDSMQVQQPISLKALLEPIEQKKKLSKRIKKPVFVARDAVQIGPATNRRLAVVLETFPKGGGSQFYSPYLVLLPSNMLLAGQQLQQSDVQVIDLQALTGAFSVRGIAALPNSDTLFVMMHKPDMLVRIGLNPPHVAAVASTTCIYPTHIQLDTTGHLYVTCYKGDMLQQYDAQTLQLQKTQSLPGMGPAASIVDEQAGYVYVSAFLADRIAVLQLQDFAWLGSIVSQQQVDRHGRKR